MCTCNRPECLVFATETLSRIAGRKTCPAVSDFVERDTSRASSVVAACMENAQ